jgi:hypothetical protein
MTRLQWALAAMVLSLAGHALAQPGHTDTQPAVSAAMPQAQLIGKARLRVFGFQIYDVWLWAAPDLRSQGDTGYTTQPLGLELSYLRDFKGLDMAERSIKEMRRSAPISSAQEARWLLEMQRVLPSVKQGDRVLSIHKPGTGVDFWVNGQPVGAIQDAAFAQLFFGIWLSPKTSEPQLRALLLGDSPS